MNKVKFYPHQIEALRKVHSLDGRAGLFVAMGGGKTRVALSYASMRQCKRLLVVLPLSVASVWEREARLINFPLPIVDLTTKGTVKHRATLLERTGDAIVLINYDSYWREPLRSAIDKKWVPDGIILDEVHRIRHRASRKARFAHVLGTRDAKIRLGLTGTPITNGLQDAWSIFRFINPAVFGNRWKDFEDRYLLIGGFPFPSIQGYKNEDEAKSKISVSSFQWEDSLPKPPDVPIFVTLSPETRKVYTTLRKESIVRLLDAEGKSKTVIAQLAMILTLRLLQITSGFTREVGGDILEVGEEKADAVLEIVQDIVYQQKRAVVFCRFIHDIELLERKLSEFRTNVIRGGQTSRQRGEIVQDFDSGKLDVLLVQIRAGGLGIDLASASAAIFYSVGHSLEDFLQAKGRLSGALRQRHPVVFYHILARGTVDEGVYADLLENVNVAHRMTDLRYALNLIEGGQE